MTQVSITVSAQHFGPRHKQASIALCRDVVIVDRSPEARPTCAGIIFSLRAKQWRTTADAGVDPIRFVVPVLTGKGPLGPFFPGDLKLLRGQLRLPILVTFLNFFHQQFA